MMKAVVFLAIAAVALAEIAQVHDYIADENCKVHYIRRSRPACVSAKGQCFPYGTSKENNCVDIKQWQWQNFETGAKYAPGVNPLPNQRITHNGDDTQKIVWAYTGSIFQGEAYQVYLPEGQVTVRDVLNTPVNHITFIANVHVANSSHWFSPGENNTDGCGQLQTWELPFGFSGQNASASIPQFEANLRQMHSEGITITLTMGSWCTSFPVMPEEEWSPEQFNEFVDYFREIRENTFGGVLDGIDWDWEGFCKEECLKGACSCGWDDKFCGQFSPEELAQGQSWMSGSPPARTMCWILPTPSSMQVMTGITHYMKQAGFVVTLAPMSTAVYTGNPDTSAKQNQRNEFVKWRKQPYPGGKPIDGPQQFDLLEMVDGVLLQWYSGFDAALCIFSDDPKACTCDNVPDADYPNTLNVSNDGLISGYYFMDGAGGNMFPTTFPVRCQACGENVIFPNGTRGTWPCSPADEAWFVPGDGSKNASLYADHAAQLNKYVQTHNGSIPYWWVQGMEVNSKCPRGLDCPDWHYKNEAPYSRQIKLLQSLSNVMDISKISIGFETLGIDVLVQMQAYLDPALPWPPINETQKEAGIFYTACTQNMTKDNIGQELRCSQPLLSQQWGLKFSARDFVGLDSALKSQLGKELAGIGVFTLDGMLWTPPDTPIRYWFPELMLLNQTFQIPCHGDSCGGRGPLPPAPQQCDPTAAGGCTVCAACCHAYIKDPTDCAACVKDSCPATKL